MNPDGVFYFRLSASTVAFLTLFLNGTVLLLVLFKTPKDYRNFSILYGAYSATEFIAGFIGWSVIHEEGPSINGTSLIISYGICANVGPHFCYFMDQFTFPMIGFLFFMAPCNMAYRLYSFIFKPLSNRNVGLVLFVQTIPWYYIWYYRLGAYVPPEVIRSRLDSLTISMEYTYYGYFQADTWQWAFMNATSFAPFICCLITLVLRQILVYKIEKASNQISSLNFKLQKQFAWMLTLQATIIPLVVGVAAVFSYYVKIDPISHPLLSTSSFIIFISAPILEASIIILCLSPYRTFISSLFYCCKRSIAVPVRHVHTSSLHL